MPPLQFSGQGACKVHPRAATVSAAIFAKLGRYARFWFGLRRVRTTTLASIATATGRGSVKTQGDTESRDQGAASGKTGGRGLQDLSRASPPQQRPRHGDRLRARSRKEAALRRVELRLGRPARLVRLERNVFNLPPGLIVLKLIVPLYLAFAIARFDGRVYSLLILLLLLNALNSLLGNGNWLLKLLDLVWFAVFIAVAFVAYRKIFPNMRLFRVKKGADGSYVWCDQERLFADATLRGMPPPVTARQGIPVSKRSRFLVILILIALVLFVGVIIRFGSGSKVTLAPREDASAYYNRGNAKDDKGDLDGAIADYNRAIELDPKLAIAYNNRGNAEKAKGDLSGAIADYNRAIELDPKHASAYYNRGNVKDAKGDLDGAIADFNLAIELDPKDADSYTNRGRCKEAKGDLDSAIADYNRAIELDPKLAIAYNNRGNAKEAKGDLDGAIAVPLRAAPASTDSLPRQCFSSHSHSLVRRPAKTTCKSRHNPSPRLRHVRSRRPDCIEPGRDSARRPCDTISRPPRDPWPRLGHVA